MYVLHQSKYFMNCLWTFVFIPTRKSSAAKFTARNGDDFSVARAKTALNAFMTEECRR